MNVLNYRNHVWEGLGDVFCVFWVPEHFCIFCVFWHFLWNMNSRGIGHHNPILWCPYFPLRGRYFCCIYKMFANTWPTQICIIMCVKPIKVYVWRWIRILHEKSVLNIGLNVIFDVFLTEIEVFRFLCIVFPPKTNEK